MLKDHDIMLAVRDGDVEKLGLLFEKHHKRLYNYFLLETKNQQASEDLVQDVFYRMLKYRHTYHSEGKLMTWMFKIARNARIDYYREHSAQPVPIEEGDDFVSSDPNPLENLEQQSEIDLLRKAVDELSGDKREIIIMSRFNNMRYEEIGKVLGCTVGTVKVRVYRAIKELTRNYFKLAGETGHEM
ncbi:RNA polymerase sigma factor [Candidatus Latescibacterota bacterium]